MRELKHTTRLKLIASSFVFLLALFACGTAPTFAVSSAGAGGGSIAAPTPTSNTTNTSNPTFTTPCTNTSKHCCGKDPQIETAIDIGCRGQGNPILDMMFAVLRLLSDGVGLVIAGSIIFAGIQYTMSAGDPQATAKAVGRIRATLLALMLYIFAYPLLNWLLPKGFF